MVGISFAAAVFDNNSCVARFLPAFTLSASCIDLFDVPQYAFASACVLLFWSPPASP